jgi:hypothetical protein
MGFAAADGYRAEAPPGGELMRRQTPRLSTNSPNFAIMVLGGLAGAVLGVFDFLLIQAPIGLLASLAGVWLVDNGLTIARLLVLRLNGRQETPRVTGDLLHRHHSAATCPGLTERSFKAASRLVRPSDQRLQLPN